MLCAKWFFERSLERSEQMQFPPIDPKFHGENLSAMLKAMDKVINEEKSLERKRQMLDAIHRLYIGEPTKLECEIASAIFRHLRRAPYLADTSK
jgi:hypothetical protein